MKTILLFISLIFVGCQNHPQKGDWYEHKGTRERVQVENVGTGKSLEMKLRLTLSSVYHYYQTDSLVRCVSFQKVEGPIPYSQHNIIPVDEFKQDYQLIE
jgi:hypothetical protein